MTYTYDDLNEYNWLAEEVDRHETEQAKALGALLIEVLNPKSVIDVGCSSGIYLVPFMERGVEAYGIDGASGVGQWIPGKFGVVDLRQPWDPPRRYDLALCIETGEHLRPEFHPLLVETLCKCSDTIFWSAAPPGQNGEGHYGERPKGEWVNLFGAHNYGIHSKSEHITQVINSGGPYDHCQWLKVNSVVLTKLP